MTDDHNPRLTFSYGLATEPLPDGTVIQRFRDLTGKVTTEMWDVKASAADAAIKQKLLDLGWTPPADYWPAHGVRYATVRDTDEGDLHVECRFRDCQKYAAVQVDGDQPELAYAIAQFLSIGKDTQ